MKFDVILANPPFNLGEKMLAKYFEIGSEICTVQPSAWLLGKQQKKDIVKHVDTWDYSDIESINGIEFFDATINGVMAIQMFKENDPINHNRRYILFDGKKYDKCEEISTYSNDKLLVKFKSIIDNIIKKYGNVDEHIFASESAENVQYKKRKYNGYVVKMDLFAGSGSIGKNGDSFYTLFSCNSNINDRVNLYNILLNNQKNRFKLYIPFNSYKEARNFYNFEKTFFCRICLYYLKYNLLLFRGELKTIPMFDFNDSIFDNQPEDIDIQLFKKYNISQDIINHILEILPNYYNLDLNKYKNIKVEN